MRKLKIALLSPFHGGSHKQWAENLQAHSLHDIDLYSMPAVYWKWRMHGASIHFAKQLEINNYPPYDLFVCTDMMNLNALEGLIRSKYPASKSILYFHENQLTYPWSEDDQDPALERDKHYCFINYISALGANKVIFNSAFHLRSFCDALPEFLGGFPDFTHAGSIEKIRTKSTVIQPGITVDTPVFKDKPTNEVPVILWNHRWEYDKNPESFYNALQFLRHHRKEFKLILLGASFTKSPPAYEKIKNHFGHQIIHEGFVFDRSEYFRLIASADIQPVCNIQEFYGISVLEAIASGVFPLLPDRLVYPEHIPPAFREKYLYQGEDDLQEKLLKWISNPESLDKVIWENIQQFQWANIIQKYDEFFASIV